VLPKRSYLKYCERKKAFDAEKIKWAEAINERGCFYRTYPAGTDNTGCPYPAGKQMIYDKNCFDSSIDAKVTDTDGTFYCYGEQQLEYEEFLRRVNALLRQKDKIENRNR
jgi:hypothetical protein